MYKPVPSRVDFPAQEREILRFWEETRTFEQVVARNTGGPRYSFVDGPITANNPMGVHHAWGRTYKDIYQRFKAMKGFDQRYQNGFDCQGLWVEVEVEKDLGLNSKRQIEEYGLQRFVEQCRQRVLTYADVITQQSIRLGMWMDWSNSYYTMSDTNIEHIWHFLKHCYEKGWLYKGWRTMPWCARCGTSLSQHELIGTDSYRDVVHPSIYVKLPIEGRDGEFFLVWTTTPWTLAANVALAVHPDLDYARVELDGQRSAGPVGAWPAGEVVYLSAKTVDRVLGPRPHPPSTGSGQAKPLLEGEGAAAHRVLETVKGRELVGWRYRGPFDELEAQRDVQHRVVPWEAVGEDEGTGIVHIAPGCGADDFTLGEAEGLPVLVPIDEDGRYYSGFGLLTGLHAQAVAETVFASLREKHMLYRAEEIEHRYPMCWRCGEQILFRAVSEWFIACDEIRPRMIEAARTVEWTPPSAGKRMEDWLNNMGDWCISRKRYWGLPLPFYPCASCGTMTVVGSVEELRARAVSGLDELRELHRPWIDGVRIRCAQCGQIAERITEVGDCWLDAGIVPFSTPGGGYLHDREGWAGWYPADWVSEMREQVRLWFYSMLFMSVALEGRSPYRAVLSYEKLMDEQGRPMHKSLGNAVWFDEAADRMGADVMRWLYAGQSLQRNLLFGDGPAEEVRRRLLTLWNVYSFFVTYAETDRWDSAHSRRGTPTKMDRWVLGRLDELVNRVNDRLEAYDAAAAAEAIDHFVDDLSNWYLRRSRRRFVAEADHPHLSLPRRGGGKDPEEHDAAFATLHECLTTVIRLQAPFMPFLAEELYQNLVRSCDSSAPESVHLTPYPVAERSRFDAELDREIELGRAIVTLGRSARNEARIPIRQPLPALAVAGEFGSTDLSNEMLAEISDELNVREVRMVERVEQLARRIVRPNPRMLGPKLGARFPEVDRALREGRYSLDADGTVRVDGLILSREEVSVALEPLEEQTFVQTTEPRPAASDPGDEGATVTWQGALAVSLDTRITPELRAEGVARQIIHRVQTMRREAGLQVTDRIRLGFRSPGGLAEVFGSHGTWIMAEVGAEDLQDGASLGGAAWAGEIDGRSISLSLERIG